MLYVYEIYNSINSWVYIGLTTRRPRVRWKEHLRHAMSGTDKRLYRAMRQHGIHNFNIRVIAKIEDLKNKDILFELEKEYIKDKNSYWFGYNDTVGGRGVNRPKRGRKGKG